MSQNELKHVIQQFFKSYEYSNLITIDENGCPKGRMMENMPLGDDMVFWFATGIGSNKVAEVKKTARQAFLSTGRPTTAALTPLETPKSLPRYDQG